VVQTATKQAGGASGAGEKTRKHVKASLL
jgi:hypothetical protein